MTRIAHIPSNVGDGHSESRITTEVSQNRNISDLVIPFEDTLDILAKSIVRTLLVPLSGIQPYKLYFCFADMNGYSRTNKKHIGFSRREPYRSGNTGNQRQPVFHRRESYGFAYCLWKNI